MARITNTKIVHHDGSIQWVLERIVDNVTYQYNVYLDVKILHLRDMCAYKLWKARKELFLKMNPGKSFTKRPPVIRSRLLEKELVNV